MRLRQSWPPASRLFLCTALLAPLDNDHAWGATGTRRSGGITTTTGAIAVTAGCRHRAASDPTSAPQRSARAVAEIVAGGGGATLGTSKIDSATGRSAGIISPRRRPPAPLFDGVSRPLDSSPGGLDCPTIRVCEPLIPINLCRMRTPERSTIYET